MVKWHKSIAAKLAQILNQKIAASSSTLGITIDVVIEKLEAFRET